MTEELDPKQDRVVAVTGAGTGIGQAIAVKFAARVGTSPSGAGGSTSWPRPRTLVEQAGGACLPHELDVTDADSVERFFTDVEAEFGIVTAVINNAATARYGPLDDFSPAEIAVEIATKFTGSLFMARRGIQAMRRNGEGGDILFITSLAAATPWPLHLPYAAASAGVEHAVRVLRSRARGLRHPRPQPALRRDDRYRLRHPRDGERSRDGRQRAVVPHEPASPHRVSWCPTTLPMPWSPR